MRCTMETTTFFYNSSINQKNKLSYNGRKKKSELFLIACPQISNL